MWLTNKKERDPFFLRSVAKLGLSWCLIISLLTVSVIFILSIDFRRQSNVLIFHRYLDISRLIRVRQFLISKSMASAPGKPAFDKVFEENRTSSLPSLHNAQVVQMDFNNQSAVAVTSLNSIDLYQPIPSLWYDNAKESIQNRTYIWGIEGPHYTLIGMPLLDTTNRVDAYHQMFLSWSIPQYSFSLPYLRIAIIFLFSLVISCTVFLFIFMPGLLSLYDPDIKVVDKSQDRFYRAWRRLRKIQVSLFRLEDD